MKRLCIILVLLALLLTACGKAKPAATTAPPTEMATTTQPPSTEAPEAPTTTEEPEASTAPPLTPEEPKVTLEKTGDCSIPKIDMAGAEIKQINEEIAKDFAELSKYTYVNTDWYVTGDVLTLRLACKTETEPYESFRIYSVRVSTQERMTDDEVLQEAGMTRAAFEERAYKVQYNQLFLDYSKEAAEAMADNYYAAVRSAPSMQPFFGEDGTLWVRGWTAASLEEDYKETLLSLDAPLCEAYYTWDAEQAIKLYTEGDISIPYLSMSGEDVKEINEEIEKTFPRTKGYYYVHTDWFVHNDILTVQIAYYEKDMGEAIKEQYCVYSLRLSDRKRMTDEEVLQEAGMSREAFEEKAAVALLDKFIRNLENSSIYKEDPDRYNEAAWKHICEEKVKTAQPYFGEDGTLWVYGWTHQIAGQGSQPEILPLNTELCEACETWLAKQ